MATKCACRVSRVWASAKILVGRGIQAAIVNVASVAFGIGAACAYKHRGCAGIRLQSGADCAAVRTAADVVELTSRPEIMRGSGSATLGIPLR